MEFLDFRDISQRISFKQVLNWLCVPFTEKKDEIRATIGELLFIINGQKNTFFCPKDDTLKGGIINFTSYILKKELRESASELKKQFLFEAKPPQRDIPNLELHYCKFLEIWGITEDTALKYEVGLVKQKSIITGRVAFKIYDHEGKHTGYIAFHPNNEDWFFPKGFKRPLYNYHLYKDEPNIYLTADPLRCLYYSQKGFNCCCLLGKSMTDEQEKVLKTFSSITLIHSEPDNIIKRLVPFTFIKAPDINKPNSVE